MRMDAGKKAEFHKTLIGSSIETINDARREFNLKPLEGGETVYLQQQDFPLQVIKDNKLPTQATAITEPAPVAVEPDPATQKALAELFMLKALQAARDEVTQ